MKRTKLDWRGSSLGLLLLGSLAFAPVASGQGSPNPAAPATPSPHASPNASTTPSRTDQTPSQNSQLRHGRRHRGRHLGQMRHQRRGRRGAAQDRQEVTNREDQQNNQAAPDGSNQPNQGGRVKGSRQSTSRTNQPAGGQANPQGGNQSGQAAAGQGNRTNQAENQQNNQQTNRQTNISTGTLLTGLINVNAQNINVSVYKLVDVHNVLNNSQVEVLTQKIENSPGAVQNQETLTNLLRNANVLNDNQVVVGVLSSMKRIFFKNKSAQ